MGLFKNIVSIMVTAEKTVATDLKALVTKAQPILVDIAADATDILAGKLPPPTGSKALDDFFKVLLILMPYYKGNKPALEADIQEALTFIEGVIAVI